MVGDEKAENLSHKDLKIDFNAAMLLDLLDFDRKGQRYDLFCKWFHDPHFIILICIIDLSIVYFFRVFSKKYSKHNTISL